MSESDPGVTAMLSQAAETVGLEWKPPPSPERLRLDDWYLGVPPANHQHPSLVPFFPEVHVEVTRLWRAPYSISIFAMADSRREGLSPSKVLPTG